MNKKQIFNKQIEDFKILCLKLNLDSWSNMRYSVIKNVCNAYDIFENDYILKKTINYMIIQKLITKSKINKRYYFEFNLKHTYCKNELSKGLVVFG